MRGSCECGKQPGAVEFSMTGQVAEWEVVIIAAQEVGRGACATSEENSFFR